MSDSVRPHRRQPTRLPRPRDSPGKNTVVGCHFLRQCLKGKSESEAVQSRPTPSDPMDCSLPGSSIHGIFQARVLEWVAIAFSVTGSQNSIHTGTLIGKEKVTASFCYHNKADISLNLHLLVAGKFKNQRSNSNEIHSGPII